MSYEEMAEQIARADMLLRSRGWGNLINNIAAALRTVRNEVLEEAAKIADDCDKSTHPADVADAIRERIGKVGVLA